MDFLYKKSGGIFNMHSYWTKQPVDAIRFFIEKHTREGDLVLDPFCGTGMTGVAAKELGRNVLLNDISPISIHISKGYCNDFDLESNEKDVFLLLKSISEKIETMYKTECEKCKKDVDILFSIVGEIWSSKDGKYDENRGELMLANKGLDSFNKDYVFKEFSLIKICYKCECSKEKKYKKPDSIDSEKWKTQNYKKHFYPRNEFFGQEPKRNFKRGIKEVWQLYSARNLSALSVLNEEIKKIENKKIQELFLFSFTSILFNSSLMSRYRSYENTSVKMGTFYVPPLIKDTNVLRNFENKLLLAVKNKKIQSANLKHSKVSYLMENADNLKSVKTGSIDYIYTDPPYSDIINYSELNIVYEAWLDKQTNVGDEMIVSHFYGKNLDYYSKRFENSLKECFRVLKDNSHLTLVFHHPNLDHWVYIQEAIVKSGFLPVKSKKPIRLISNSKTSSQHKTSKKTQCFLVFNLKKSLKSPVFSVKELGEDKYRDELKKSLEKAIKDGYKNESDQFDYLINDFIFKFKLKNIN
jgi:DNA modification methylase